jgi:hypothetical protein
MTVFKKISLFKSLFNSRKDVFAIHWEKGNKSGYMPACIFDPYRLRVHKMNGGTFKNFADRSYLKLTDEQIVKHLNGEQYIGLYPLCPPDNTSWFIVADFDEGDWLISACKFIDACMNAGIPAYLERLPWIPDLSKGL